MKFNIFDKKYQYIGLHINAHALKALQFERSGKGTNLVGFVNATMAPGMIANDVFTDHKGLGSFITKSITRPQFGHFTTDRVVISIPESKSFIRVINMPKMAADQAENAIMFEAEAYIPLPIDQVYFDWRILAEKEANMDVLLIASPKEYVDAYIDIIEKAGLKLCGIEVEAQSVTRALVPSDTKDSILIADMDALKTALIMIENGVLQFTSSVPIAGNVFTERLSKALSVPTAKAEQIKRKFGLGNTVEYPNLRTHMLPCVEDLAAEIKNILKFHYDHSENHIGHLVLTGGGAKLQHINEVLEPMLEASGPLRITVADPLQLIPNLSESKLTPYEALSFTTAIGLAMWGITEE